MPVTPAFCNIAKQDLLNGVHAPGDVYKIALYNSAAATLDKTTAAYTTTGEISGPGYTAGGATLAGRTVGAAGDIGYLSFDDPSWANASFTADAALIYNASKSNKALGVLSFTAATSTNGTWTLDLPAAGAAAILRLA